jgi:serine/threonine-protein kinase
MASQAGAPADDPDRGRQISKYHILTRLSVGGMAELFLAFTAGPGGFRKFVALKQILPDVKTEEFVKMFLDEARITAAFSHANIGQVFDLGEEKGELYLAMEFLAGQNLEQLIKAATKRGEPLPPGFVARVIRDVCLGLHYAHHFVDPTGKTVAVVHRDMSPRNVMVTYDGGVKVIDFGIAKAKGRLGRTAVGMVKGTGGYMSPEQVRGRELDGRSDLFAAGVLLFEMLCGRRLFDAPGDAAMMMQIVEGDIPYPRTINPKVSLALETVVLKALSRDINKRFATGREMAKALEQALGAELFDEEKMAGLMDEYFADKRQKTRALLEYASRDDERISEAAGALQDEVGDTVPTKPVKAATPKPRSAPTPAPIPSAGTSRPGGGASAAMTSRAGGASAAMTSRAGGASAAMTSRAGGASAAMTSRVGAGSRPKKPGSDPAQAAVPTTPRGGRPRMPASEEAPEPLAQASEEEAGTDGPTTQPFRATPPARPAARGGRTARELTPADTQDLDLDLGRKRRPPAEEKSGWVGKLVFLSFLGGSAALIYFVEPVRNLFKPGYESAVAWVKTELELQPAPPPPEPEWPPQTPPPNPLAPKPETPTPDGAEVAANPSTPETPTPTEPEAPEQAEPKTPDKPGTAVAKNGQPTPPKPGTPKTPKPKDPAAQVTSPKTEPGKKPEGTPPPPTGTTPQPTGKDLESQLAVAPETTREEVADGTAEVLDTSSPKAMKKAGIGLLTLTTVPPAAVYDGQVNLGTTPLRKVPLQAGTYKLRIVDPDGISRLFSAPVELAKEKKYAIRVSDLPVYPE